MADLHSTVYMRKGFHVLSHNNSEVKLAFDIYVKFWSGINSVSYINTHYGAVSKLRYLCFN